MSLDDYQNNKPIFKLEEYFNGKTIAHGVFENRSGKVINQFKAHLDGRVEKNQLCLDEAFTYQNGEVEHRKWIIDILPDGYYEGRTNGVIGIARGQRKGNAFNWKYIFDMPVKNTSYKLNFNDWMFLQDDGVMINRVFISKFGINFGNIILSFQKQ